MSADEIVPTIQGWKSTVRHLARVNPRLGIRVCACNGRHIIGHESEGTRDVVTCKLCRRTPLFLAGAEPETWTDPEPTIDRTLTLADAATLSRIVGWTRGARVAWIRELGQSPVEGVVRCIGTDEGNRLGEGVDVRDGFVRISSTLEWFLPVPVVMDLVFRSYMVEMDR